MPVLKTYKNGMWEPVSGMSKHTHTAEEVGAIDSDSLNSAIEDALAQIKQLDQFILTDEVTGVSYKLSIADGKLKMTEVAE